SWRSCPHTLANRMSAKSRPLLSEMYLCCEIVSTQTNSWMPRSANSPGPPNWPFTILTPSGPRSSSAFTAAANHEGRTPANPSVIDWLMLSQLLRSGSSRPHRPMVAPHVPRQAPESTRNDVHSLDPSPHHAVPVPVLSARADPVSGDALLTVSAF